MSHDTLAREFNGFAYELFLHHSEINETITSLKSDIFLRRILFNRYYYALYHKYLDCNSIVSSRSGSSKHDAILKNIMAGKNTKLIQTFSKLLNLRVWADYKLDDSDLGATEVNLNELNKQVWSLINARTIC